MSHSKRKNHLTTEGAAAGAVSRSRLPWWKKAVFSLLSGVLFFAGLEIVLLLCGFRPALYDEDPYVGFTSHAPLFVEQATPGGGAVMATARNKLRFFSAQEFSRRKAAGTYRIFCMGGSTTYGRPYDDKTSFCGWLRALLPVADPSGQWELINAGGISYASYRVAMLMEELISYDPDLFIIYSGQNEFLERRTYEDLIETPAPLRGLGALASHTRTYSALRRLVDWLKTAGDRPPRRLNRLAGEVDTLLNRSIGPDAYSRDDERRRQVLAHFRYSLSRMVDIARSAGAGVILVTPASNLRHCSPFKSQHRAGLSAADREEWQTLFGRARQAQEAGRPDAALAALEAAARIDDRYAHLHYWRGRVLDSRGRHEEARAAYQRALEEDVCPLRAFSQMRGIVAEVAAERGVARVDFAALVQNMAEHGIPGEDLFLDHVHPRIEVHRALAVALAASLAEQGVLEPGPEWREAASRAAAIDRITQIVEGRIDRKVHGAAMRKLAMVMAWAGKFEDGHRAAGRAVELAPEDAEAHFHFARCAQILGKIAAAVEHYQRVLEIEASSTAAPYYYAETYNNLAVISERQGKLAAAEPLYQRALRLRPDFTEAHYNLGVVYNKQGKHDEAAARFVSALRLQPDFPEAYYNLGVTYERQGKLAPAEAQYRHALLSRPGYAKARLRLGEVLRRQGKPTLK